MKFVQNKTQSGKIMGSRYIHKCLCISIMGKGTLINLQMEKMFYRKHICNLVFHSIKANNKSQTSNAELRAIQSKNTKSKQ